MLLRRYAKDYRVEGVSVQARHLPVWSQAAPAAVSAPRSVRVSLTDRCDLACVYCRPSRRDGYLEARLEGAGWRTMLEGLALGGVARIRFTGGEPLLYGPLEEVIAHAVHLGFEDIALTTNATRLAGRAHALRAAGLQRLTISIDSLDATTFARLTRGGRLADVLAGIAAARAAGFAEIKLNCVVLRGENDGELESLVRFAWARDLVPRFLEVMPIGEGAQFVPDRLVTVRQMREQLAALLDVADVAAADPDRGPARYVRARHDARLRVGFISGTSDTFCAGCDRLRVAADGFVRPCLSKDDGSSARLAVDAGSPQAVADVVSQAWELKPDGLVWKGCTEETARALSMRAIGG
jgi:GTP 3',8-cyclase